MKLNITFNNNNNITILHLWNCCFVMITTRESKSDISILLAKVLGGGEVGFVLGLKIQQIQFP